MQSFDDPRVARVFVLSHPNHELAIYGLMQRLRPHVLVLSDGGGPRRVAQSRLGFERIGLLDQVTFLDHPETGFYDALLGRDRGLFDTYVSAIGDLVDRTAPEQVFCDAVEGYNPGHDMSLPLVRAALAGREDIELFEFPLIHQQPGGGEEGYLVQRVPASLAGRREVLELSSEESAAKQSARDEVYTDLFGQLGARLMSAREGQLETEEVMHARDFPLALPRDVALRYEWRGEKLRAGGDVDDVITYEDHWLPMVDTLLSGSGAA